MLAVREAEFNRLLGGKVRLHSSDSSSLILIHLPTVSVLRREFEDANQHSLFDHVWLTLVSYTPGHHLRIEDVAANRCRTEVEPGRNGVPRRRVGPRLYHHGGL